VEPDEQKPKAQLKIGKQHDWLWASCNRFNPADQR
jgi:hypothetical protein